MRVIESSKWRYRVKAVSMVRWASVVWAWRKRRAVPMWTARRAVGVGDGGEVVGELVGGGVAGGGP